MRVPSAQSLISKWTQGCSGASEGCEYRHVDSCPWPSQMALHMLYVHVVIDVARNPCLGIWWLLTGLYCSRCLWSSTAVNRGWSTLMLTNCKSPNPPLPFSFNPKQRPNSGSQSVLKASGKWLKRGLLPDESVFLCHEMSGVFNYTLTWFCPLLLLRFSWNLPDCSFLWLLINRMPIMLFLSLSIYMSIVMWETLRGMGEPGAFPCSLLCQVDNSFDPGTLTISTCPGCFKVHFAKQRKISK